MIGQKIGKLANRLILFAHVAAAAREHDFRVWNPTFDEYAQYFESFRSALVPRYPVHPSRIPARLLPRGRHLIYGLTRVAVDRLALGQPRGTVMSVVTLSHLGELFDLGSPKFLALLPRSKLIALRGWGFRDNDSFREHADVLRRLFLPISSIQDQVARTVRGARHDGGVLVGVHVRRGDYRTFRGGRFFYDVDRYRGMMEHVRAQLPHAEVRFLVCSDEEIELDAFSELTVTRGNGLHIVDLYSLAECDYIMGPPSSFSLWASFYGKRPLCWLRSSSARPDLGDFRVRYPGESFDL